MTDKEYLNWKTYFSDKQDLRQNYARKIPGSKWLGCGSGSAHNCLSMPGYEYFIPDDRGDWDSPCWFGTNKLCIPNSFMLAMGEPVSKQPYSNSEYQWFGTGPFCDPGCDPYRFGVEIKKDRYGNGGVSCISGNKVLAKKPVHEYEFQLQQKGLNECINKGGSNDYTGAISSTLQAANDYGLMDIASDLIGQIPIVGSTASRFVKKFSDNYAARHSKKQQQIKPTVLTTVEPIVRRMPNIEHYDYSDDEYYHNNRRRHSPLRRRREYEDPRKRLRLRRVADEIHDDEIRRANNNININSLD